jgi:hypothetical protein
MKTLTFFAFTVLFFLLKSTPTLAVAPPAKDRKLEVTCRESFTVTKDKEYQKLVGELEALGANRVQCFSCYRDPEYQKQLCLGMCGKIACPGRCAAPGKSQHQKKHIVTCDLTGLPKGQPGCEMLKKLCDEQYGGKCGIGGYPGGGFHFGVHDDHFSSWNQCRNLKWNVVGRAQQMQSRWTDIVKRIKLMLGGSSGS